MGVAIDGLQKSRRHRTVRRFFPPLFAAALLALFVLLLFYRLLFTDRVLASGDILHYFYPYRDYAAAALRAGRVPLWNPYIFAGAPFLANPQAAALYPLHWPLSWLPITRQLYWSGAIHAWILALGGCALMRRWGTGWPSAICAGLVLAGSGYYGGLLGHINQMNGAAWLPWLLWALEKPWLDGEEEKTARFWRILMRFRWYAPLLLSLSLLVALTLLAGHTQTTYISLVGVAVWLLVRCGLAGRPGLHRLIASTFLYAMGVLLGALIAAAQLLPTLELSQLGIRGGGLDYAEVTSFSLRPLLLHWTLLPSYGLRDLSAVFATLGYTEYIAYVGALGLILAVLAVAVAVAVYKGQTAKDWTLGFARWPPAAQCGVFFAAFGLFLAMGRWNPFTFLLYQVVPGFDLFRTPARWMMLYTLGMAVLAGLGAQQAAVWIARGRRSRERENVSRSASMALHAAVLGALAVELLLAARALPHARPTAPQAVYDVRTAPAHLLTEPGRTVHPAAMGRFLSISEITYDPGDMADWRRVLRGGTVPQLSEAAFTEFVIALKAQEILAPNLSLLWRVPAVDGFDGGVLPLQRYNAFFSLLIPPEELVPDGRVREQLRTIPAGHILELMDVRHLITDKVRDVWFDDVYYDRQIGATLTASGLKTLTVEAPRNFAATEVAVVGSMTWNRKGTDLEIAGIRPLAEVEALVDGERLMLGQLLTGDKHRDAFLVAVGPPGVGGFIEAPLVHVEGDSERQEYLARFPLAEPSHLQALDITLTASDKQQGLAVQAVTLIDERTRTFVPLLPSDRGRFRRVHSGDVKIYERLGGSGRVQLVESVRAASSQEEAVALLRDHAGTGAVVEASAESVNDWGLNDAAGGGGEASLVSYSPEQIVVRTDSERPGLLILKDAYYPGWEATVNGEAVGIYPANVLFRGVPVPAGESEVVFRYRPQSWRIGLRVSAAGVMLWLLLALVSIRVVSKRGHGQHTPERGESGTTSRPNRP
ncbi:MAG: YfhO family protein [Caldilineaceae bacterium]|nr:YfhO family protein [Caldilineaceae bacterium]